VLAALAAREEKLLAPLAARLTLTNHLLHTSQTPYGKPFQHLIRRLGMHMFLFIRHDFPQILAYEREEDIIPSWMISEEGCYVVDDTTTGYPCG
jgi:hypothetical protein